MGTAGWIALKTQEGWADALGADVDVCEVVAGGWHAARALRVPAGSIAELGVTFDTSTRILCAQGAFKLDDLAVSGTIFGFRAAILIVSPDGELILDSPEGTHESAPDLIKPGTWHYLEVRASQGTAGRRMRVLVDGIEIFDVGGIQTVVTTDYAVLLYSGSAGCTWSEVIVMDGAGDRCNDLLGMDARIALLQPASTAANEGWTADPNVHSYIKDPLPGPSDASSVFSPTAGTHFFCTFGPPPVARSYEAVVLCVEGLRSESGSPAFRTRARSSGVTIVGDLVDEDVGDAGFGRLRLELDPHGSKAWTRSTLSALQAGVITEAHVP